jgi:hypothetical protein
MGLTVYIRYDCEVGTAEEMIKKGMAPEKLFNIEMM